MLDGVTLFVYMAIVESEWLLFLSFRIQACQILCFEKEGEGDDDKTPPAAQATYTAYLMQTEV